MCGICGIVWKSGPAERLTDQLHEMCAQMVHRGPDSAGYYTDNPARFAFASELKALVAAGLAPRELDPDAVDEYLGGDADPPRWRGSGVCGSLCFSRDRSASLACTIA